VKRHLGVLDGLRGTAAISVVIFHFSELSIGLENPDGLWLRHAYLAVDFFFCLSGYVIGFAYDDRRDRMNISQFLSARLIRLHPMVVAGLLLGLASFMLDPFSASNEAFPWMELQVAPIWKLVANSIGGVFMLPTWSLPNRFGSYFSLNSPAWSLMWEYVASVAFALLLWRMKRSWLIALVIVGAVGLGVSAFSAKVISLGFGWGQAIYGLVRITSVNDNLNSPLMTN
jgi:peptidoglycan/LPS O-acetylase OafA/YrhL